MYTTTSAQSLEELNRQKQQVEMIRQYLQVTNVNSINPVPIKHPTPVVESCPVTSVAIIPSLASLNLAELRVDLKMAEERVERLREELEEMRRKRHDSLVRSPPPPYVPPSTKQASSESVNHSRTTPPPPFVQELTSSSQQQQQQQQQQQNPRSIAPNMISSPILFSPRNSFNHFTPISVDASKDHCQRQFLLTMSQHREQLVVHLDSLKQALNSLERLATLEPTRTELHLANMKLDKIQQKSRQLRALKSNRANQHSPFIECRIRQLEHDLVYMLSEHQKDVQAKLELNEQQSLLLLKIMQVQDELSSVDQQIQQLSQNNNNNSSSKDMQRINLSSSSDEMYTQQQQPPQYPLRFVNATNNSHEQSFPFRDRTDNNPLSRISNIYSHQSH
ncbi:unnamed protein product [Adineta ricciae]|uniref:Uncharacterized protein n=1 Tax=Adineta ricciae TaxID=249248 RepID=A0A815ESZ1_ADIRI|nr:unnamed protein product [Adineta ricciae]CAF1318912.1 unnamed protein product [Adineta ricciae]